MRSIVAMGLIWLAAAGFGCNSESAGDRACQKLEDKLAQCGLVARGGCDPSERCPAECFANAECSEFAGGTPSGALVACIAACSGAGPDDFICKDGTGFVNKRGVCDGRFQCQDGSDEASCAMPTAGTSGAGNAAGVPAASGAAGNRAGAGGA